MSMSLNQNSEKMLKETREFTVHRNVPILLCITKLVGILVVGLCVS